MPQVNSSSWLNKMFLCFIIFFIFSLLLLFHNSNKSLDSYNIFKDLDCFSCNILV